MRPGKPRRARTVEVDAAQVDEWLKEHGLHLLREGGWSGNDGAHRIQVLRTDLGGVCFRMEE